MYSTCTCVEFAMDVIHPRNGYLSFNNAIVMPRCDFQAILNCVTVDLV